jgi:hypothetical protein
MRTTTKTDVDPILTKIRALPYKEFMAWCGTSEGKAWIAADDARRDRARARESSAFVALVRRKLDAAGHATLSVAAATPKTLSTLHDGTEWDLSIGATIDGSRLVCKHHGDSTKGDFGTSFVVFTRVAGRWSADALVLGPAMRPNNWGGRTTKSLDHALATICGEIAKQRAKRGMARK